MAFPNSGKSVNHVQLAWLRVSRFLDSGWLACMEMARSSALSSCRAAVLTGLVITTTTHTPHIHNVGQKGSVGGPSYRPVGLGWPMAYILHSGEGRWW